MNEITPQTLAKYIQYTNVRPDATRAEIITHVESTQEFGFNTAMIAMCWVPMTREILKGTGIRVACPGYLTHSFDILGFSMNIFSEVGYAY